MVLVSSVAGRTTLEICAIIIVPSLAALNIQISRRCKLLAFVLRSNLDAVSAL